MFIDSNYSCGIQCADFCVGAIHKKFENDDDTFFNLLLPAIRTNKSNNIYGYGINYINKKRVADEVSCLT